MKHTHFYHNSVIYTSHEARLLRNFENISEHVNSAQIEKVEWVKESLAKLKQNVEALKNTTPEEVIVRLEQSKEATFSRKNPSANPPETPQIMFSIQAALHMLGHGNGIQIDGMWGPQSRTALKTWQANEEGGRKFKGKDGKELTSDGEPGPNTIHALIAAMREKQDSSSEEVEQSEEDEKQQLIKKFNDLFDERDELIKKIGGWDNVPGGMKTDKNWYKANAKDTAEDIKNWTPSMQNDVDLLKEAVPKKETTSTEPSKVADTKGTEVKRDSVVDEFNKDAATREFTFTDVMGTSTTIKHLTIQEEGEKYQIYYEGTPLDSITLQKFDNADAVIAFLKANTNIQNKILTAIESKK